MLQHVKSAIVLPPVEIDVDIIRRFDAHGPRYTSYPTADRFVSHSTPSVRVIASTPAMSAVSCDQLRTYVHLPFCSVLCFYCGCNKVATRDRTRGVTYLKYLAEEIALQASALNGETKVNVCIGAAARRISSRSMKSAN